MRFRPCIDLHGGTVKQIVGATLNDAEPSRLRTNFVSQYPPEWYARLYKEDNLTGGHVIMLGPGNEGAAARALAAWPGGLQVGGGITRVNAAHWLEQGASHVIVTSWVFRNGIVDDERLDQLKKEVGAEHLVLDLSCRRKEDDYFIVTDRWQNFTDVSINAGTLSELSGYCSEFLIHAADVEGKCGGIETDLVRFLGEEAAIPTTYAGGIRHLQDLELILQMGQGKLDATIGSALDIFGGSSVTYQEAVAFHRRHSRDSSATWQEGGG